MFLYREKEESMTATKITSPSGKTLHYLGNRTTTALEDSKAKVIRIAPDPKARIEENEEWLRNANVSAFLKAVSEAEGGGYDFKYGAVRGKRNDPWRFTDMSTHPGPGCGGKSTAAGMYQITIDTWRDHGGEKMGLTDFTPRTQDLIAVDLLRHLGIIEKIKAGDIAGAMPKAAGRWSALSEGPGRPNHYPGQPYMTYEKFLATYQAAGGAVK
jgi:muramidase (phage lysozyme)